jgi:hypothetical protein
MEWKAMNEQDKQDLEEISVQTSDRNREKPKNKRSAEEKIGRLKYHEVLTKKVFAQNERLLGELRWIRRRLETGLALYIVMLLLVSSGFLYRFRIIARFNLSTNRFVYVGVALSFYILIGIHVLHGLGIL